MSGRRVGMWTLGLSLIGFGVLFLLHTCFGLVDYRLLLALWPLVFIFLGIEITVNVLMSKKVELRIDLLSVVTIFLLLGFAGAMGIFELVIDYYLV